MSGLDRATVELHQRFDDCSLLKVISGLNNFDIASVRKVSRAAGVGGADLLDVACDPEIVEVAARESGLPVCVSSVEPELFLGAVDAGASLLEIGNFDAFYPQGRFFSAEEVLSLASRTKALLPNVMLSVTVPHVLPFDKQAELALDLIANDVDIIQTEGGTSARPFSSGTQGLIEKAAPTLAAAHAISSSIKEEGLNTPVICASGLSAVTVPMAIAAGAAGVGIGSAINRLDDELAMIAMVKSLRAALPINHLSLCD